MLTKKAKCYYLLLAIMLRVIILNPCRYLTEGWQSGQMQRTVNPSTFVYDGSNPSPSTTDKV